MYCNSNFLMAYSLCMLYDDCKTVQTKSYHKMYSNTHSMQDCTCVMHNRVQYLLSKAAQTICICCTVTYHLFAMGLAIIFSALFELLSKWYKTVMYPLQKILLKFSWDVMRILWDFKRSHENSMSSHENRTSSHEKPLRSHEKPVSWSHEDVHTSHEISRDVYELSWKSWELSWESYRSRKNFETSWKSFENWSMRYCVQNHENVWELLGFVVDSKILMSMGICSWVPYENR